VDQLAQFGLIEILFFTELRMLSTKRSKVSQNLLFQALKVYVKIKHEILKQVLKVSDDTLK